MNGIKESHCSNVQCPNVKCKSCGQLGHVNRDCPSPKPISSNETTPEANSDENISKIEKGTTEAASKICFTASMDSIIKSLRIHDIVEDVIFFKKILQKFSIDGSF